MFHRWAALVLVLALCAMSPKNAAGQTQSQQPRGHGAGGIGGNYPNPFNPDTHILFTVGDPSCTGGSEQHVVSMRILNVLAQFVATPLLEGGVANTSSIPGSMYGSPITNVKLGCGNYSAYWSGKIGKNNREAASGVYLVQLFVDNALSATIKIYYAK